MRQICPWCNMEVIWDPVLGPEEECPHCGNELGEYRTVKVDVVPADSEEGKAILASESSMDTMDTSEVSKGSGQYQETVEQFYFSQEDSLICSQCQDQMLLVGKRMVRPEQVQPVVPEGLPEAFLSPPFQLNLFVCPGCFHVSYRLDEQDQKKILKRWNRPLK